MPDVEVDVFADDVQDPFDPAEIKELYVKAEAEAGTKDDETALYIQRRKIAYARVFSAGETDQADVDFVMKDLAMFCRAFQPTFNVNGKIQDLQEGRKEVYYRIIDWSMMSISTLVHMYTNKED